MPISIPRRVVGVAILVLWAGVVGMHIRREYFKPMAARLELGARSLAPGSYFYVVRMQGHAIGIARSRFDTLSTGFVFEDNIILDVPALDTVQRAVAQTRIEFGKALELQQFKFDLTSAIGRFGVEGKMRRDSQLDLEIDASGKKQHVIYPASNALMLDAAVPLRLAAGKDLAIGKTYSAHVFDPSSMSDRETRMTVTARQTIITPDSARWDTTRKEFVASRYDTIPVWRIEQQYGGIKVGNWVDEDGHLVRAESPLGFTLERTAYELANQEWKRSSSNKERSAGYGAIIEQTAIASNVNLGEIGSTKHMRVRLKGVDLEGFDLSGGRQQLKGDTLTINQEDDAAIRSNYTLPFRGNNAAVDSELVATPLIQSNDMEIIRAARRMTQYMNDPVDASRKINTWVYKNLRKEITPSVPSALQVLHAKEGDCNEHTVLYVALARSLGLPTRTAVGLVYVRGRFYYHAWPEVYLNNNWVAVDPTLGQYPADASHIRLLVGGLARQVELIRLVGRLQLEVLPS
jgi:hypothetical protein